MTAVRDPRPIRVFYGAASRAELVCWDQLSALIASLPDGRLHGAVEAPPGFRGREPVATGYVTDSLPPYLDELGEGEFYLAGPPPMVTAVLARLRDAGIQLDRIHYDRFA